MAIQQYSSTLKSTGGLLAFSDDIAYDYTLQDDGFGGSEYVVNKTIKDAVKEIDDVTTASLTDLNTKVTSLQDSLDNATVDDTVTVESVTALSLKINEVDTKVASMFVCLTLEEYDALETKQDGVLYLIKLEETTEA